MISNHFIARLLSVLALLSALVGAKESWASLSWDGRPISDLVFEGVDAEELSGLAKELGLLRGKILDVDRLDASIIEAARGGKWMRVFVYGILEGGNVRVVLSGFRVRRLRNLTFTDVDTEVFDEVKRKIRQEADQTADLESFGALRQALREGYQERGYYFADILFTTRNVGPEEADVDVRVVPNAATTVKKVVVRGAPDDENAAMKELVPLQPGEIFSKLKLGLGVEKINTYLRANQYPTSRVADTSFLFSADSLQVEITVILKMGERFQIRFSGNEVFEKVQLRALLTDDVLAQTDPSMRIVQLVEAKYRAVGYADCSVQVKKTLVENGKLNLIDLQIAEGERVRIDDLRFLTGDRLGAVDLEALFYEVAPGVLARHLYWAEGVPAAVAAMQARLVATGYLNSHIGQPKVTFSENRRSVILFFDVDVGVQTILSKVEFVGISSFSREQLEDEASIKTGQPFNREWITDTGKRLLTFYKNSGFPFAKFTELPESTVELSRDQQSAVVRFKMDEGKRFHIGAISIDGLRKTKAKVVLTEMQMQPGDIYSARKIRGSEEAVSLLGLFSHAEIAEIQNASLDGVMDLRVVVRESMAGVGEMGMGAVYEEPRFRFRSFAGAAYRNVSGLNQTASVRGEVGVPFSRYKGWVKIPFLEYAVTLGYRYPHAFSLPFTFNTQFVFDRVEVSPVEQTILTRARVETRLEKRFTPYFSAVYRVLHVERTTTENYLPINPSNPVDANPLTENIGSTGPGLIFDFRDDTYNPTRGSYHTLDVELAEPWLLSQDTIAFVMALNRNSFYFPIIPSVMKLALSLGAGVAHSFFGNHPIARARLVNELALGGQTSIRGIAPRRLAPPDATNDTAYYNARSEITTQLISDLGLAVFFDTGQIFPGFVPSPSSSGFGLGLRYKTPVGPVSVDFAQGLGPLHEVVKFYFSVSNI